MTKTTTTMQDAFERARVTPSTPAPLITMCLEALTRAHERAKRKQQMRAAGPRPPRV